MSDAQAMAEPKKGDFFKLVKQERLGVRDLMVTIETETIEQARSMSAKKFVTEVADKEGFGGGGVMQHGAPVAVNPETGQAYDRTNSPTETELHQAKQEGKTLWVYHTMFRVTKRL